MNKQYTDIHEWIIDNNIKNEKGELIEFYNHPFLFDIYSDQSQNLTIMKAAQVGLTTSEMLKNHFDAKVHKMDIIYCVDEKTEILTKRGFLYQNELTEKDKILTLSIKGKSQWSRLKEIFRKEVNMECIEFKARNFNAIITPNHRWLLQPYRGTGKMFFRETKDMIGKYARIPKSVEIGATPLSAYYTDEKVKLLAWIFSEGHYPKQAKNSEKKSYSIIISQSEKVNSQHCDEIRSLLKLLNTKWKEYKDKKGCIQFRFAFQLGKEIKERFSNKEPDEKFALYLTKEQCKLFIDTFAKGDGWCDRSGTWAITQKSKKTIDVLCMIAVLAGYVPSVQLHKSKKWYTIRFTQFKSVETNELKPKKANYNGIIWCPRTQHGTFYARRNGRCYWTGNTLPTDGDVKVMVGGKTNRIIMNNPCMLADVKDKDSVESKQVDNSMIYFRGTWTKKAAMMTPADRVVHDEKDSSKLDIIADYQSRLQHSKFKQTHTFSHPSLPETGIHNDWLQSDQNHWFVKCPHCKAWQYLSWDTENPNKMSIDLERKIFICKICKKILPDYVRRNGQWVAKYKDKKWRGYWVPLLIAPWISAEYIVDKFKNKNTTTEFFWTKILGLPYADASSKMLRQSFFQNLTGKLWAPNIDERIVIGVDTGLRIDYVMGNKQHGLFFHGDCDDYGELDVLMKRYKKAIVVIDAGGDLIGSRSFAERWTGRVFLCYLGGSKKTNELVKWGNGDEFGAVHVDRNRMIQLVIDEFREKRIIVHGTENDWYEYWCFDGGTLIKTEYGEKPIKDIEIGESVYTRKGLRKVYMSGISHPQARVMRVVFSDGKEIIATPNHKVWVRGRGFISIDSLLDSDMIEVCNQYQFNIKEKNINGIPNQNIVAINYIIEVANFHFIVKYGKMIMEKYRRIASFTTKIIIHLTMRLAILPAYPNGNTISTISMRDIKILQKRERFSNGLASRKKSHLLLGITPLIEHAKLPVRMAKKTIFTYIVNPISKNLHVRRAVNFIKHSILDLTAGVLKNVVELIKINKLWLKKCAFFVAHLLRTINIGVQKHAPKYVGVVSKELLNDKRPVYNLSVEDEHEYYANGVLVSNCDWNNLSKIKVLDSETNEVKGYKWVRNGRDHRALATIFWRVGIMRFGDSGILINDVLSLTPNSYEINPNQTVDFNPKELFDKIEEQENDWRL